ncbi:MAG: UDP-N-acetylglucosamine 1-carboxyvinyltransferase [Chitinophagales bacterium]|nr:UDP-N-acetylglucosamine 1-carboxyvinyltransferase [Chitinophagales bacterium]
MASFEVIGGQALNGTIVPQGAKNEALQIISAVLLTDQEMVISNIPQIADVLALIDLLASMGVEVKKISDDTYSFKAANVNMDFMTTPEYRKRASSLRGSVMVLGPLLTRFGRAYLPKPGGDKIGRRRMDTHLIGFQNLGATFNFDSEEHFFRMEAKKLKGTYMLLEETSVTGTANIVMAAVLAEGTTTIFNAACEPYLQQLCNMLNRMGAKITGIGSNLLTIEGVTKLGGTTHRMLPDMIEVGSFIGLAAMTQSNMRIQGVGYEHLGNIPNTFRKLGIQLNVEGDDIVIPAQAHYEIQNFIDGSILTIDDAPWPGFTPDLISIVLVTAIQAKGNVLIHQKMFESRLFFVDKLIDMGAQIILCDPHRASIMGLNREHQLKGISMTSPDIRAGVALLIAALSANGKSTIHNIEQIDRGYQFIDQRLNAIGANIKRINN